jgi:hypothetical protein
MDVRDGIWVPVGRSTDPHFVADGLKKGSAYQFRVKAVNAEGQSEPLETEEATVAKNPYDKPDRPGTPEPTGCVKSNDILIWYFLDWDVDHVDLKWLPPSVSIYLKGYTLIIH